MIPDFKDINERTSFIDQHADYWTVVRFRGQGDYERHEFPKRSDAFEAATKLANDTNTTYMIYAVLGIYDTFVTSIKPYPDDRVNSPTRATRPNGQGEEDD